ncbi:MAG: alpha/beta hydrolase [Pseudohongiella sp.]|nr:alpha/beta hydrolase [Pseudohongiella sp.]
MNRVRPQRLAPALLSALMLIGCVFVAEPNSAEPQTLPPVQFPEPNPPHTDRAECVILLHGMGRTDFSMRKMARTLADAGYSVSNVHYESRTHTIEQLADLAINEGLEECRALNAPLIHFATHSLGGILVRYYLSEHSINELGRIVMLAPPNHGSQIIDVFGRVPGFELFTGDPASQLGTAGPDSIPANLPPVDFELGVIAGNRSFNPIFSMTLPEHDDGKVTVESTKIDGMLDFIEMPYTHTFIMQRAAVIAQVIHFLKYGEFNHPPNM